MKRKPVLDPADGDITDQKHSVSSNGGNSSLGNQDNNGVTGKGNASHRNYKTFDGKDYSMSNFEDGRKEKQIATDVKTEPTFTMQEALDFIGFGPYQVMLSVYFGLTYMAESMETMLVSVLVPAMRCVFPNVTPYQQALLPMVAVLGLLLSGAFWGKTGDKYGRRTTLILSNTMCGYFGLLSSFSPSYPWVVVTRLLVSFALGAFPQMIAYYGEFLPTKSRSTCIIVLALIWAVGSCFEIVIAMVTLPSLQWQLFLVLSSCPIILFTMLTRFLPESPRHLLAHGRYDEAMAVLRRVAKMNKKELPEGRLDYTCNETLDRNNLADLFVPKYIKTTIVMAIGTAAISMAYYGTALLAAMLIDKRDGCHGYQSESASSKLESCQVYCQTLSQRDYVDLLFTSLGEAPGVVVCVLLMAYFGRKTSLTVQMSIFTLALLASNFCAPRRVLVGLFFLARAMADGATQGGLLYATEVYPTSIRAIGMGWVVSFKGIGYLASAVSANIFLEYSSYLAISSLAAAGLIGTICFAILPYETKDRKMLDTLKESAP